MIDPMDLLRQIEKAQGVKLIGRVREFYTSGEVLKYQDQFNYTYDAYILFDSRSVLMEMSGKYPNNLIIIAGLLDEDGILDEQTWVGINPSLENSPVYELSTASEFTELFQDFDEFLIEFRVF